MRERLYRTEAIVIRRSEIGEADRLLTLYTPQRGKLRVIAKGVRKPTSHLAGHVEPFARVQMLLAKGANLDIVTQSETVAAFRHLREDLECVGHAYYMAELLDRLTPDNQENPAAYHLLAGALTALDAGAPPGLLVRWYELQMLDILGYRPELGHCVECRSPLEPLVNAFVPALGGVVCPACKRIGVTRDLSVAAFKVLRHLQRSPWPEVARVRISPPALAEVDYTLRGYVNYVLEHEPRSAAFLRATAQLPPA
jgi:DNA repair protein RecO (recombination protein O)